jgi:hypothetical protein
MNKKALTKNRFIYKLPSKKPERKMTTIFCSRFNRTSQPPLAPTVQQKGKKTPEISEIFRVKIEPVKKGSLTKEKVLEKRIAFVEERTRCNETLLKKTAQIEGFMLGMGAGLVVGIGIKHLVGLPVLEAGLLTSGFVLVGGGLSGLQRTIQVEEYLEKCELEYEIYVRYLESHQKSDVRERKSSRKHSSSDME